jgi:hypothetical protein
MPELEVEQQGPAEANAIEYFSENIHAPNANPPDGPTQHLDD